MNPNGPRRGAARSGGALRNGHHGQGLGRRTDQNAFGPAALSGEDAARLNTAFLQDAAHNLLAAGAANGHCSLCGFRARRLRTLLSGVPAAGRGADRMLFA